VGKREMVSKKNTLKLRTDNANFKAEEIHNANSRVLA
jgi:hypothetical protein